MKVQSPWLWFVVVGLIAMALAVGIPRWLNARLSLPPPVRLVIAPSVTPKQTVAVPKPGALTPPPAARPAAAPTGGSQQPEAAPKPEPPLLPAVLAFNGSSKKLTRTVIVPSLDSPVPDGKNAIWCASMQLAWNHFCSDIMKGPMTLIGAEKVSARLNAGPQDLESDLPPGEYFAVAGSVDNGVLDRIKEGMARFPDAPMPDYNGKQPSGDIAFGYLRGGVRFSVPYFDNIKNFTESAGQKMYVKSFGADSHEKDEKGEDTTGLREQAAILYYEKEKGFILDLCRMSSPSQVVVASIPWKGTLAATYDDATAKIATQAKAGGPLSLTEEDDMDVPDVIWRIAHHFPEMEGKAIQGTHNILTDAEQVTDFRLDRYGAAVQSTAAMEAKCAPSKYLVCDHPFIIYMKVRDASYPYFAMWVDNAELLTPWTPPQ